MPKTPDKPAPRRRAAKAGSISSVRPSVAASSAVTHGSASPSALTASAAATSSVSTHAVLAGSTAASTPAAGAGSAAAGSAVLSGSHLSAASNAGVTAAGTVGSVGAGPVIVDQLPPVYYVNRPLTSLFDPARPGKPVVRPSDLLALRLELVNMTVQAGTPPLLKRGPASGGASYIVLHFPPQALAEQVFFQAAVPGTKPPRVPEGAPPPSAPGANETPLPPPIRARIAGESRLVFKVPDGFSVPYQLADVLAACQQLAPNVPANALPRSQGGLIVSSAVISAASLAKIGSHQRAALSSFALRSLSIEAKKVPPRRC